MVKQFTHNTTMDLIDNRAIPVTDEQVNAFKIWVIDRYGGRALYELALHNTNREAIEYYFAYTIFSEELVNAYNKSKSIARVTIHTPETNLLQLYRRRIDIKISRTSADLLRRAFPQSKDNEYVSDAFKVLCHTNQLRTEHYWQFQGRVPRYTILIQPTAAEVAAFTPSLCNICLSTHQMLDTCVTKCGHEFGSKCFREWEYKTCPTCSEFCHEVTEFVA